MQKIKKYFQTTIIALMALVMMVILTPLQAKAGTAGHSADDAINWVKSKVGTGLDYDGAYGNQCVDLICYYYQYLGQRSLAETDAITHGMPCRPDGREFRVHSRRKAIFWCTPETRLIVTVM